jgi:hypothetical protein
MCERLVLYQTVLSDTPEIRSLRLVLAEKHTLYQTVLSDTLALCRSVNKIHLSSYSRDWEFKAAP